jgi:hypothetical protein
MFELVVAAGACGRALGVPSVGPAMRLASLRACGSTTTPGRAVCVLEF